MPIIEKGQITVGKGRGHWVKKSEYALDINKGSFPHFSKFKRPYGWANIKEK